MGIMRRAGEQLRIVVDFVLLFASSGRTYVAASFEELQISNSIDEHFPLLSAEIPGTMTD